MATTYIEPLRSVRQRTDYTEGVDGERPLAAYSDLGSTALFVAYCERARALHGRKVEAYGVRISFDNTELSTEKPEDVQTALDFGREVCKRVAPGCPCHVVAHGDGVGGKLHVHCEIANADALTGKAVRENRSSSRVRRIADGLSRELGLSVIGETCAKRMRWEKARGIEPVTSVEAGWQDKRGLPSVDSFERALGDAVAKVLESSKSVEDFKTRLADLGIGIVEVPQREKNPETGKKQDVVDPSTGKPIVACWRYTMRDETGRVRRRKDSNLCEDFRMHHVLPLLESRESAIASERAAEKKAAQRAELARIERNEKEKASRRPRVEFADVSEDLDALWRVRFTEVMTKSRDRSEPLLYLIRESCMDESAKRDAALDLRRAAIRAHNERSAENMESETPAQTAQAVLSEVERRTRNVVTRMLAALWRMRIVIEQRLRRAITKAERNELAAKAIKKVDAEYGTSISEPTITQDAQQMELEFTYSRRDRQLSL